jgi:hypothetical protein
MLVVFSSLLTVMRSGSSLAQARGGFEVGLNIVNLRLPPTPGAIKPQSKVGYKLGLTFDFSINKILNIESGAYFSTKGTRLKWRDPSLGPLELKHSYHYLEVPVLLQLGTKNAFLAIGPYVGFAIGARVKLKVTDYDTVFKEKLSLGNDPEIDALRRGDLGLNFKAGYVFKDGSCLAVQYGLGLVNTAPGAEGSQMNSVFCISFGVLSSPGPKRQETK